jgi:hypothetical protein
VDEYEGPTDSFTNEVIEGAFAMKAAGVDELIAAGKSSPLGEREYWRRILMEHAQGPQLDLDGFESVWREIVGEG